MNTAKEIIKKLKLIPHPEGGYYREMYRSSSIIMIENDQRNLSTSIYFMLTAESPSRFHQLKSDEIWYFHSGVPLILYMIDQKGNFQKIIMSNHFINNEQVQVIIPAGTIFGAEIEDDEGYALISCMVSPGFNFHDFRMVPFDELNALCPDQKILFKKLS